MITHLELCHNMHYWHSEDRFKEVQDNLERLSVTYRAAPAKQIVFTWTKHNDVVPFTGLEGFSNLTRVHWTIPATQFFGFAIRYIELRRDDINRILAVWNADRSLQGEPPLAFPRLGSNRWLDLEYELV